MTVTFDACDAGTEVTVEHVQIPEHSKTGHAAGWDAASTASPHTPDPLSSPGIREPPDCSV